MSGLAQIARVARAKELRRVQGAFLLFSVSEHGTWLAVLFFALQRGGAREVGVVAVAQLLPGVLLTPFSSYAGDRFDPRRALAVGYAVQSVSMVATAIAMWNGEAIVAYVFAAMAATAICFTRPVMGSLLPTVTHSPADLVAANVVTGLIEQIGVFFGPIMAGALMALASPAAVFAGAAALTAFGCVLALAVESDEVDGGEVTPLRAGDAMSELMGGFAALRRVSVIRVFVVFIACAGFVKGIGDVIFVTFTDARLDGTAAQSGVLAGAYGLGGLLGAASVTHLVRARRVSGQLLAAGLVVGAGLVGMAAAEGIVLAAVFFALLGGGESALALTSSVSIQRVAPTDVLSRVFGIVEAVQMGCIALGSLAITVLVSSMTLGEAFVVLAGVLTAAVVVGVLLVRGHQAELAPADSVAVDRLLADPLFEALPAPTIERLARGVEVLRVDAGTTVVSEGEIGDRYYLVREGQLDVSIGGALVRTIGSEGSFGEIALLRDVPRTATVTATTPAVLQVIGRDAFLEAVTGHSRSLATAHRVIGTFPDQR